MALQERDMEKPDVKPALTVIDAAENASPDNVRDG